MRETPFLLHDTNGPIYHCRISWYDDGTVGIWIPYGARVNAKDAGRIAKMLQSPPAEAGGVIRPG